MTGAITRNADSNLDLEAVIVYFSALETGKARRYVVTTPFHMKCKTICVS